MIPSFSKELTNKVDDLHIPDGALTGFILGEQYYVAYFTKSDKWKFEGYKTCIKVSKDGNCSNVKFYTGHQWSVKRH
ncbi:hypothetical protein BPO_p0028 (plasmid) [Bergeyella porcorum]|uniref:Uncharacterized protein n=1 Tax=Bergeyella porcorum TaxID=1735111 RepID=A0AAU0F580_9FLAO